MSVPKSRRTPSRFEVLYNAEKLRDELTSLILRSFGVYSRNGILRKKYSEFVKNSKNEEYIDLMIQGYKDRLFNSYRFIEIYLYQAKSIYPSTKGKLDLRIYCQNKALLSCIETKTTLGSIAKVFNVDLNYFKQPVDLLNKEIKLIKAWQQSDSRKFNKRLAKAS